MTNWRWDQGRLLYFQFENIRLIAKCLAPLDGMEFKRGTKDFLREQLESNTNLPFLPKSYTVWRNYARVFACSLLASRIDSRLVVTDLCRKIAGVETPEIDVDEYISFIIKKFYFPFPAFKDYDHRSKQVFPFCAILKYLIANFELKGEADISLQNVFRLIIGNSCTGVEPKEHYLGLRETSLSPSGDAARQVREMLTFVSQMSFLKWFDGKLYLDILPHDVKSIQEFQELLVPAFGTRNKDADVELIHLGSATESIVRPPSLPTREIPSDILFTEGKKVRTTHLRVERSPRLRKLLFETLRKPVLCNMCSCDTKYRYPWTENLLEVHHLLPLSSSLSVTAEGTSLDDVVPLCPSCHKSVHIYYRNWLGKNNIEDFSGRNEAIKIYREAKTSIQL